MTVTQHVRMKRNHMATTFDFVVSLPADRVSHHGPLARVATLALTRAHERVARLENELSEYREGSPVRALNLAPPLERIEMPPAARELLARAERIRVQSQGRFDCSLKGAPGQIAWDDTHAWRTHPDAHLGFGAIGKGYALDCARLELEVDGFGDYLLSGGGSSVILSGFAAPGDPWTFGWSWKKDTDGQDLGLALTHASGRPIALGISGTHEKGAHIIIPPASCAPPGGAEIPPAPHKSCAPPGGDEIPPAPHKSCAPPRGAEIPPAPHKTGAPLRGAEMTPTCSGAGPASALVGAASATDADAWSTALFVAGFETGLQLLADAQIGPSAAIAQIDSDGTPRWNGSFQQLWGAPV